MKNTVGHPGFALLIAFCVAGLSPAEKAYADVTYNVNSTLDRIDDDVSDGNCHTTEKVCSLRAAIMQANHLSGPGTTHIKLLAGTYTLTRPATGQAREDNGDLNLTFPLASGQVISIEGASAASSVIDANQIDRVLTIDELRTVNIEKVTIRGGFVGIGGGGGIDLDGKLTMIDSIVADNFGSSGAGIFVSSSAHLDVLRSTFSSNRTNGNGGAVFLVGPGIFRDSSIVGNLAVQGGAIYIGENTGVSQQMINTTIRNNSASGNGGGISNNGQLFLVNSTISGNTANANGGGIANQASAWLYSSSIIANDASHDRNPPGGIGGGVFNFTGQTSHLIAINSLIADNTILDSPIADDCNGVLDLYGWNLLSDFSGCSFAGFGTAARGLVSPNTIGPLADNGGPTWTHALLVGSEAIDTTTAPGCIDNSGLALATDQRGAPRVAGAKCDVGAYEYGSVVPPDDVIYRNGFD